MEKYPHIVSMHDERRAICLSPNKGFRGLFLKGMGLKHIAIIAVER